MPILNCSHPECTIRQFRDDMYHIGNERYVCISCGGNYYYSCSHCGNMHLRSTSYYHRGYHFCTTCRVSVFTPCEVCQQLCWINECTSFAVDNVRHNTCSEDCCNEISQRCDDCGGRHMTPFTLCPTKYPPIPTDYKKCYLPNRVFGLELETNVSHLPPVGWKSVTDGSIRGLEYLSGPILGEDAIKLVESGCTHLNQNGPCIDEKCGFHLHINARDKTEDQLIKFIRVCHKYENDFKMMVPKRRRNMKYCRDLPSSFNTTSSIEDCLYNLDSGLSTETRNRHLTSFKRNKYHDSRYYWVNLHSYYYRGTVEIRLHSGTALPEKILRWTEMWLKLFEWTTASGFNPTELGSKTIWGILKRSGVRKSTIDFYRERTELFSPKKKKEDVLVDCSDSINRAATRNIRDIFGGYSSINNRGWDNWVTNYSLETESEERDE